jgi:hypothetical protein
VGKVWASRFLDILDDVVVWHDGIVSPCSYVKSVYSIATSMQGLGIGSDDHALNDEVRAFLPHLVDYLLVILVRHPVHD